MNRTMKPAVSVCMPVYNRAAYIEECVESILAQTFTDFELVIVDDGSTDGTCGLIRSFRDPRIRLIRGTHDYIASCNRALDEARGKYVARMDSDDLMMPDRLRLQYDYLEAHPGVDILGGDMRVFGEGEEWTMTYPGEVDVRSLYERGSGLAHPTVMMRRESIDRLGIRYERPYIYAEDYAFWARAAMQGLAIRNLPEVLVRYRLSHSQATFRHAREQARAVKGVKNLLSRWMAREEEAWARENPPVVPRTDNKLTVIIPFLNEKEEVAKTVRSIREHVGMEVDILVINDQSNDGYDYRGSLRPYDVTYVYNIERKGVAASRDYGVSLCRTPYFLLLDAHMRFYDDGWHRRIARLLDEDDRCLLCCQTRFLGKKDGEVYLMEDCPVTYGACLQFNKKGYMPGITWNCREHDPQADIEPIEAVLGAGYAASKRYWQRIRGLEGLMYYGSDEAFLSLKVWGEGGRCLLLKDTVIGHIYRDRSPYKRFCEEEVYNYLFIADVLFPASLRCMAHAVALSVDSSLYAQAVDLLRERKERNGRLREEIAAVMENPVALLTQKEVPLDGNAYVHNKVKKAADSGGDTYHPTLERIRLCLRHGFRTTVRLNFTEASLPFFLDVVSDFKDVPADEKVYLTFNPQRVWQDASDVKPEVLEKHVRKIENAFLDRGFAVSPYTSNTVGRCYADDDCSVTVNYDGNLFKCTARDFAEENKDGILDEAGRFLWNENHAKRRSVTYGGAACRRCRIFPLCHGGCSQQKLERYEAFDRCVKGLSEEERLRMVRNRVQDIVALYNLRQADTRSR